MEGTAEAGWDLDALRRQDAREFARLVGAHQDLVLGLAQSLGLRGADLDEAGTDVFAAVYLALPRFEGRAEVSTWVYRIAYRTILKVRRRYGGEAGGEMPEELPDQGQATPAEAAGEAEERERVWAAVAQLETRQAVAVELHYRREWPVEQIAAVMECPEGTVKTLLFRGRQRLRELLSREEVAT